MDIKKNMINTKAPLLTSISAFIHELQDLKLDSKTLNHAAMVVADTYGTAFSGIQSDAFRTALKSTGLLFGKGDFAIWGTESKTSLLGAIFYNSLAISSTDFDEGHRKAVGHPASAVVPVAMILGEYLNKTHIEILKSVIIGYEVGTRFSMARIKEKITTYSTGRWAAMASASAAAYLLGMSPDEISHALSNAAVLSPAMIGGSTDVSTGSMSKEGVAWALQSGVQSALMAKDGFSGPYLFVDEHDDYNTDILLSGLGDSWFINSNYFKPYACCRWLHSGIRAAEEIRETPGFECNDIEEIKIFTFSRAIDLMDEKYPDNTVKAQFHFSFVVALMLINGRVSPEYFQLDSLKTPSVISLIDKITIEADQNYTNAFPEKLPSRVEIRYSKSKFIVKEIISAPWEFGSHPDANELKHKFDSQTNGFTHNTWESFFSTITINY